jgi:NAD+ diphosphatase
MSFRFCPSCGAAEPAFLDGRRLHCASCGFEYFHNVATAAGILIDRSGEIVFVERAKEPRRGKLGLPGGFVDPGEGAEEAAFRECREEIGWAPPSLAYLGSFPNSYDYGGVSYNTCDLFFYYRFFSGEWLPIFAPADGEVEAIHTIDLSRIHTEDLAFPSLAWALEKYREMRLPRSGA